jgi:hypothetical protein
LFVWNLKDPKQKTPLFSTDGDAVVLPITFSLLEVRGSFEVTTPCACYGFLGNEFMSQTRTQTGHLFESFASSSLDFTLAMAGSRLTYSGVAVPGVPSMKAVIDSDLPDWLQQLGSIMSGHDIGESIRRSMVNVFATAQFTLRMIETMNKAIGLAH